MKLEDYLSVLRRNWWLVAGCAILGVAVALVMSALATPKFVAKTSLFVTTPTAGNITDSYQGNIFVQQRLASYTKLLAGDALAQRVVDKLRLTESPADLAKQITAKSTPETVVIEIEVVDPSPERAANLANTVAVEFAATVSELEKSDIGDAPLARAVVAERAEVPDTPDAPGASKSATLGGLVGLIAGYSIALLRTRFDKSARGREHIEDATHTRVLASLPKRGGAAKGIIDFDSPSTELSEVYRSLASAIGHEDGRLSKVTVISSSEDFPERALVAANLAGALADSGNSVVLVDADMRTAAVTKDLGKAGDLGLSSVLRETTRLQRVVQVFTAQRLSFVPAGPVSANPSQMLARENLSHVLDELQSRYDHVIVAAPAIADGADTELIARRASGALLVVRDAETSVDDLSLAAETLAGATTLLGVVLVSARRTLTVNVRSSSVSRVSRPVANSDETRPVHHGSAHNGRSATNGTEVFKPPAGPATVTTPAAVE